MNGRHTSRTDLPLTAGGERKAIALGQRLAGIEFSAVYSSPMGRALRTAELAGFPTPIVSPLLKEFDYGSYEGLTTAEIQRERPGWELFRDGCQGGESPREVYQRAGAFIDEALTHGDNVLAFAHGHILRMVAVVFLGLRAEVAAQLSLDVATIGILREGDRGHLLQRWNAV